jgi:hypothetical protein
MLAHQTRQGLRAHAMLCGITRCSTTRGPHVFFGRIIWAAVCCQPCVSLLHRLVYTHIVLVVSAKYGQITACRFGATQLRLGMDRDAAAFLLASELADQAGKLPAHLRPRFFEELLVTLNADGPLVGDSAVLRLLREDWARIREMAVTLSVGAQN